MSPLKNQLTEDMKNAMRARDSLRLNTIRFLLSIIKNWEIDNGEQDDAGVLKLIASEVKKMKDALIDFEKAGRQDLVSEETSKVAILEAYLPQQLSEEELMKLVVEAKRGTEGANFGEVMRAVMAKVAGRADGGRVSAAVKQLMTT